MLFEYFIYVSHSLKFSISITLIWNLNLKIRLSVLQFTFCFCFAGMAIPDMTLMNLTNINSDTLNLLTPTIDQQY